MSNICRARSRQQPNNETALLFGRNQGVISRHIANIFKEKELDKDTSMQKMHKSNSEVNNQPITIKKEQRLTLFFSSGASDGNRTRIISLEG